MTNTLGLEAHLSLEFPQAVARTRAALGAEGFGVLTEIDVRSVFRNKLDRDFRPYVILGACNPALAHTALSADPSVGLLLPCNVTVEADPAGGSTVRLTDPEALLTNVPADDEVRRVSAEAGARMRRAHRVLSEIG